MTSNLSTNARDAPMKPTLREAIEFRTWQDPDSVSNTRTVSARVTAQFSLMVSDDVLTNCDNELVDELIKERLRNGLAECIYGDIRKKLVELQLSYRHTSTTHWRETERLFREAFELCEIEPPPTPT